MKAVLIMGSTSDQPHADKITSTLDTLGIEHEVHAASAHKNPEKVLEIIGLSVRTMLLSLLQ